MSATLKQLRDQIIIDTGIEGNAKFPDPRLNRMINLAQRYVQIELNGLGSKRWEVAVAITSGLGASTFAGVSIKKSAILSTACPNMLESPASIIYIDCNDGSTYGIAYEVDKDRFLEQISNGFLSSTLKQPIFMRLANYIYLAPATITAATVFYYKGVVDLSGDSDATEIPLEFEEYIIKKVKLEIDFILGRIQEKEAASAEIQKDINSAYQKFLMEQQPEMNRAAQQENKSKLQ